MKVRRGIIAFFDRVIDLSALLAVALGAFLMLGICAEITARNLTRWSLPWMFELTEYSLLFMTFLGTARLLKTEGHVKMDIVFVRLKPRAQVWLNIITSIICAIVCLALTWYGIRTTGFFLQTGAPYSSVLEPPMWIIVSVVPLGFFLLSIQFLRRTYGNLGSLAKIKDLSIEGSVR